MALIKCFECGNMVSDKAETCVHCGAPISLENLIPCPECSAMVDKTADKCSQCGYPMSPQKVQIQCPECSTLVDENVDECPECGFPMTEFIKKSKEPPLCEVVQNGKSSSNNNQYKKLYKDKNQISRYKRNKKIVIIICIGIGLYFIPKNREFWFPGLCNSRPSNSYSGTNSNTNTYEEGKNNQERNRQNDLTIKLLNIEKELRETVDELAELYNENGSTGLRGVLLKQRVVLRYDDALNVARQTGDASLVREYERRKEKAISAMRMMN